MKITHIEIQNFKAFFGNFKISLDNSGKNLLLYGENGSGKSSLFYALKLFLESAKERTDFLQHKNIFVTDETEEGFIKLTIDRDIHEWQPPQKFPQAQTILDANQVKGFLNYQNLLETYLLHSKENSINLFHLLVGNLLAGYRESSSGRTIGDIWNAVVEKSNARRNTNIYKKERVEEIILMNRVLRSALSKLETKINELLNSFNYAITCSFDNINVERKTIILKVTFFDKLIQNHHHFLNEARLSAIALSIYFASILQQPSSELSILALDDVLVGLDMANRLPVIDILEQHFTNHQIFFITHDKLWFEMMRMRTNGSQWKYAEFYCNPNNGIELPIYVDNKAYLERAKEHLQMNDHKAAVIYARTAFEVALKKFCETKYLKVKFRENIKELKSNDFWDEIKLYKKDNILFLNVKLIDEIEFYRNIVLNPLSHSRIINITKNEVDRAIQVIESLQLELNT